jgi:hypothetical protein
MNIEDLYKFDVTVKDEGDFFTVTFQSNKSKELASELCVKLENESITINYKTLKSLYKFLDKSNVAIFEF